MALPCNKCKMTASSCFITLCLPSTALARASGAWTRPHVIDNAGPAVEQPPRSQNPSLEVSEHLPKPLPPYRDCDVIVPMKITKNWTEQSDHRRNLYKQEWMRRQYGRDLFVFHDREYLQQNRLGFGQIYVGRVYAWFEVQDCAETIKKYEETMDRLLAVKDQEAAQKTLLRARAQRPRSSRSAPRQQNLQLGRGAAAGQLTALVYTQDPSLVAGSRDGPYFSAQSRGILTQRPCNETPKEMISPGAIHRTGESAMRGQKRPFLSLNESRGAFHVPGIGQAELMLPPATSRNSVDKPHAVGEGYPFEQIESSSREKASSAFILEVVDNFPPDLRTQYMKGLEQHFRTRNVPAIIRCIQAHPKGRELSKMELMIRVKSMVGRQFQEYLSWWNGAYPLNPYRAVGTGFASISLNCMLAGMAMQNPVPEDASEQDRIVHIKKVWQSGINAHGNLMEHFRAQWDRRAIGMVAENQVLESGTQAG